MCSAALVDFVPRKFCKVPQGATEWWHSFELLSAIDVYKLSLCHFATPLTIRPHFAGSSKIDIGVPKADTVLAWETISDYVQQCRWSRVLGGVHFEVRTSLRSWIESTTVLQT